MPLSYALALFKTDIQTIPMPEVTQPMSHSSSSTLFYVG